MNNQRIDSFLTGEADVVKITTIMDNYIDVFLVESDITKRWGPPNMIPGKSAAFGSPPPLLAEHGLSLLIQVFTGDQETNILFDTGFTEAGVPYNLEKLGIDAGKIDAIVLSHGHPDHTAATTKVIKSAGKKVLTVTHPDAFRKRYLAFPDGSKVLSNTLSEKQLTEGGADLHLTRDDFLLTPCTMVSGEIDMENDFELHFPLAHFESNGCLEKDYFDDEKSLIIKLKEKGLIVISGCGHRGIINTLNYAQKVTGVEKVHAVIGGFHLTGATPTEKITRTVDEMKRIGPAYIVPTHCTGLKAMKQFANAMAQNFILNAVGTQFTFVP